MTFNKNSAFETEHVFAWQTAIIRLFSRLG